MPLLLSTFGKTMETTLQEVIYSRAQRGFGKLYIVKVGNGYMAIVVKPREDAKPRSMGTKEILE
jgi:hypothetical protein